MNKQKMTIHRALVELKLIDSKIEKSINLLNPVGMYQEGKLVDGVTELAEFEKNATSKYQSVTDMIDRKCKIKTAIVAANAVTTVTVNDKTMTIADAITFKTVIEFKKQLIKVLDTRNRNNKALFIKKNEEINAVALNNAKIMLGRQDDNAKPTDKDVEEITTPYIKRTEFHFADPLEIEIKIEQLQIEVENFEAEVDAVLSEVNSLTIIEI